MIDTKDRHNARIPLSASKALKFDKERVRVRIPPPLLNKLMFYG